MRNGACAKRSVCEAERVRSEASKGRHASKKRNGVGAKWREHRKGVSKGGDG